MKLWPQEINSYQKIMLLSEDIHESESLISKLKNLSLKEKKYLIYIQELGGKL